MGHHSELPRNRHGTGAWGMPGLVISFEHPVDTQLPAGQPQLEFSKAHML